MLSYIKLKQTLKKCARYSSFLSPIFSLYLKHKTVKEALPELIREFDRFYKILKKKKINVVLDVGAHDGITGICLRDRGYSHKIISFEPRSDAFSKLQEWTGFAPPWECFHCALGKEPGQQMIKILGNKTASSFLQGRDILKRELANYGGGHVEKEERVEVKRLDDVFFDLCKPDDLVLLKIDTQGFEKQVLEGGLKALRQIRLVKMELSLVEIYEGETLMHEMIPFMASLDYCPVLIERGHVSEESLYQLQADIVFTNLKFEDTPQNS